MMKPLLLIFIIIGIAPWAFADESPKEVARAIVVGHQQTTITLYGKDASPEDRAVLDASKRLERYLLSDKSSEEALIAYAIIILRQKLNIVEQVDGTGTQTELLNKQKMILGKRLVELDEAEGSVSNP